MVGNGFMEKVAFGLSLGGVCRVLAVRKDGDKVGWWGKVILNRGSDMNRDSEFW